MFRWKGRSQHLLDEMETHIAFETDEGIARGMTPEQARRAAQKKFGSLPQAAERARMVWGWVWLERLLLDVRYAVRGLLAVPAYTVALIGTLAVGLGSVATMLAIVDSVLLRPVTLPHSEQLMQLRVEGPPEGFHTSDAVLSYPMIEELRRSGQLFASVGSFNSTVQPVKAQDGTRISVVVPVSADLFRTVGIDAVRGRLLGPADSNSAVAVIGNGFWRDRFHSTPEVLGMTVEVQGKPRTIVGVTPPNLVFPPGSGDQQVYVPVQRNSKGEDELGMESGQTLVRLKAGVEPAQALAEAQSLYRQAARTAQERTGRLAMRSYQDVVTGYLQKPLWTLLAGVGAILLLAYANAANLQIGRATNRMGEVRVRAALGASVGRIVQQLVVESLLVSWTAGALAVAIAYFLIQLIRQTYGGQYTRFDELALHASTVWVLLLVTTVASAAATVAPALRSRRQLLRPSGGKGSARLSRLPAVLVALQIAMTCVLLVVSGLLHRTLQSLGEVKLGFDPHDVSTLVLMPENQRQAPELSRALEGRLLERFAHLPGVQGVTMQSSLPFSSFNVDLDGRTDVEGHAYRQGESAHYSLVSTNFLKVSGLPLLQGRGFTEADETSGSMGVLVNQAFVHTFVNHRDPLGTTLRFHRDPGETDADQPVAQTMTVLGVVENELQGGALDTPYQPMVYLDFAQFPRQSLISDVFNLSAQYAFRSSLPEPVLEREVRAALKGEAPGMVEMSFAPMADAVEASLGQRRLGLRLVAAFSSVAVVLAAAGLYGVLASSVALRRREIGIRMALGSSRRRTALLVLRQAGAMVLWGLLPGVAGAWVAAHAIRSFLYSTRMLDASSVALVVVVLVALAFFAAALPTLRAVQVEPAETLRAE